MRTRVRRLAAARARLTPGSAPADAPNVLLVVIDTLRADHLGTHGYRRNTSPNLDRLAGEATLFENAVSQAPWTAPSVATLFTGLYPSVHGLDEGVRWGHDQRAAGASLEFGIQKVLGASQVTLAEVLRSHGYRTAGFVSAVFVNSIFGFAQGFQVYDDEHADYSGDYFRTKRRAEETNRRVFAWLGHELEEPFFLFVHYIDPHWPYDPPRPHGASYVADYQGRLTPGDTAFVVESGGAPITGVDGEDLRYLIGLYDGEIHYVDAQLAALLERVRATPTERGLLTVVTADHGEEFLDHGSGSHGYTLFEEQVHVPLVLHFPGRIPSRRIQGPVGLVDVMPTILELVGVPGRPGLSQGESLLPLIDGRMTVSARVEYSEATYGGALRALQTSEGMKLIHSATHEGALLFSLLDDPGEKRHLGAEMSELADGLAERIERWSRANRLARLEVHGPGDAEQVELDSDIQERLRALGYIR